MPVRFAVAAGARLLFSIPTSVKTPPWQGFSSFPFISNAWGWLKLALSALPSAFHRSVQAWQGNYVALPQLWRSWGGDGGVELTVSPAILGALMWTCRFSASFFRRVRENLSVCLSPSLVGWWCLFNLPRNNSMNLRPSVWIQSFLAGTVSPFKHLWAF